MTTNPKAGKMELWFIVILSFASLVALTMDVSGAPQGASIIANSTEASPAAPAGSRADDGGTINVLTLDSTQQNNAWKGYVGNVSGRLTLDDSDGNTIYDWAIAAANIQGEVYVSRNNSVSWSSISCANQTIIDSEQTVLSMSSSEADSLNSTFNETGHATMQVGTNTITQNTCRSIATFINDTRQDPTNESIFQEILLQDQNQALIYATNINQDQNNYKTDNSTYDFQLIVAEDDQSGTPTTYYFYMEIGS